MNAGSSVISSCPLRQARLQAHSAGWPAPSLPAQQHRPCQGHPDGAWQEKLPSSRNPEFPSPWAWQTGEQEAEVLKVQPEVGWSNAG